MLPSVGASSAALTTYAQAAIAVSGYTARDPEAAAHAAQAAARRTGDGAAASTAPATLAHDAERTLASLFDTLYRRVDDALLKAGLPPSLADEAARKAVQRLAEAVAGHGEYAARIVQALLDALDAGKPVASGSLLHLIARGLTVTVDRGAGTVEVSAASFDLPQAHAPGMLPSGLAAPHHLLDVTDRNAAQAAPVLEALSALHDAAASVAQNGYAAAELGKAADAKAALAPAGTRIYIPADAFAATVEKRFASEFPGRADLAASAGRAASHLIAATANAAARADAEPSLARLLDEVSALHAVPDETADADGALVLVSSRLRISVQPRDGAILVQAGSRAVAFAPASLAPATTMGTAQEAVVPLPRLPGLEAASLPVRDISPSIPPGRILDEPAGVPFVPPEISDMPPAQRREGPTPPTADTPAQPALNAAEQNAIRLLEQSNAHELTILRSVHIAAAGHGQPPLTRLSLDLSASVGPAPTAANQPKDVGRLGRSHPAPAQTEDGPVARDGYADAPSSKPPVLPPWQMLGAMPLPLSEPVRAERKAPARKPGSRREEREDDSFTRDAPAGYEGIVYASVGFDV